MNATTLAASSPRPMVALDCGRDIDAVLELLELLELVEKCIVDHP